MLKEIVILANNMLFLQLLIDNLPQLDDIHLTVVNESRVSDKVAEIRTILEKSSLKDFTVISAEMIINKLKKEVIDTAFVDTYVMGLNILIPWYMFKTNPALEKLLFLDDDIIINKSVTDIFNTNKNLFYKLEDRFTYKGKNFQNLTEDEKEVLNLWLSSAIRTQHDLQKIDFVLCSGHYILCKPYVDLEKYEELLAWFYTSDVLENHWNNRVVNTTQLLDEMFLTTLFKDTLNSALNACVKMYDTCFTRKDIETFTILHVANTNQKIMVYDQLIRDKFIKGKRLSIPQYSGIDRRENIALLI